MKTKLTITVEQDLVPRAKRYARRQGLSLSAVIENALRDLAGPEDRTFVEKWRGQFELVERDDERYKALMEKYG
jgi:hypothetical protein